jgi:hypothetical protein
LQNFVSLLADDLALMSQDRDVKIAERQMHSPLDTVDLWAAYWKMEIAAEKSDTLLISLDPA